MSSSIDSTELAVLQEYADNRGVRLRVDREKGVIPGVKLLGTLSRKGREYPKEVMARALPLYEGMRVNVDHVEPGQRRSLRDRIGLVRNVTLREDGLYGDFHFNPKHALAEQIAWDAENAPQNLGFSHDTRGTSRTSGGRVVVESIDKVLSVDLVANPATTAGLFEDDAGGEERRGTQELDRRRRGKGDERNLPFSPAPFLPFSSFRGCHARDQRAGHAGNPRPHARERRKTNHPCPEAHRVLQARRLAGFHQCPVAAGGRRQYQGVN